MTIKWVECAAVLFFFSGMGMYASSQLGKRKIQLKNLEKALLCLEREVDYHLAPLADAFFQAGQKAEKPWNLLFQKMGERMAGQDNTSASVETVLLEAIGEIKRYHPYSADLAILTSLGRGLGELDKEMQIARIKLAMEEIRQAQEEAREEQRQKEKLYQTLGVCMGILGVILIL